MPESAAAQGRAWPSPRSWSACARLLGALPGGLRDAAAPLALAGLVGEAAAGEALEWMLQQDLPDPEALLADPAGALPDRGDRLEVALSAVVAAACAQHPDRAARIAAARTIIDRCPRDIGLSAAGALQRSCAPLTLPAAWVVRWAGVLDGARGTAS